MTQEQICQAWALRAQHKSWKAVGEAVGLPALEVRNTLYPDRAVGRIGKKPKVIRPPKPERQPRVKAAKKKNEYYPTLDRHEGKGITVPQRVLMERDARLAMAPRSLTALIMGDPPIGRSALDRKRA